MSTTLTAGKLPADSLSERIGERGAVELPTLAVALIIYAGFFTLTWFFRDLPLLFAAPIGFLLLAWYSSFQHETIHGHPTSSRRVNAAMACVPLALWIPYRIYRLTHLQHHRHGGRNLTYVEHDPESFYRRRGSLGEVGAVRRALYASNCTLIGRLSVGPAVAIWEFWASELDRVLAGDRARGLIWARHVLGVAAVLVWAVGVCHTPLWVYLGLIVYPSVSLGHLRSFAEHRADGPATERTTVVEANRFWALLYLNNNLHIAHHAKPKVAWYRLPQTWSAMREAVGAELIFRHGYAEVAAKYLLRPVICVEHPATSAGSPHRTGSVLSPAAAEA